MVPVGLSDTTSLARRARDRPVLLPRPTAKRASNTDERGFEDAHFIVFAFEITHDFNAILPLMLVCVIADAIALRMSQSKTD